VTQATADGGIDGVINALQGKRARKGVFITTSRFSPDAHAYVEHIDPRVVLVDGERLARLMIEHGVGVTTIDTVKIGRIDSDYFVEE